MSDTGMRVLARLSPREKEVLVALCEGRSNAEIAEKLRMNKQVAKNHLRTIFIKTGQPNRMALVIYAFYHGMVICPCRCARCNEIQTRVSAQ